MIELLLKLSLPLSVLLLSLILTQKFLLSYLGTRSVYALWASVPVLIIALLVSPSLASHNSSQVLERYQVGIKQLSDTAGNNNMLLYCWLVGVIGVLTYLLLSYVSNSTLFQRSEPVSVNISNSEQRVAANSVGPFITGFIKPKILLPHDFFQRYSDTQQRLILQHELTHWRRGDLHFNYLALLLLALCWFNPLCWLAYSYYRQAQELSCDALVLSHSSKAERIAYGHALLSSTQQSSVYGWPLNHHYGDYHSMKQRILQLQQQQGFSKTWVMVAMAAVLGAGLLLNQPVFAASNKATELAPTMRVEPRYPLQAAKEGVSGYVHIKFDVDGEGNVQNAHVIKAMPEQVFEKEALKAVVQWKYSATGKVHKDQLVQLDFELDTPADMESIDVTPQEKSMQ
jgi:TonB family protein